MADPPVPLATPLNGIQELRLGAEAACEGTPGADGSHAWARLQIDLSEAQGQLLREWLKHL